jgi:UDP-N-acetylglucosamine 2-epimerase (non-hydrolysing)/GDP/UDP-N,N'-diacetylbacillosamine 2-epimerase (hydrolysing)
MSGLYAEIAAQDGFELHLIVTGMHLLPEFKSSLGRVRSDAFGALYEIEMTLEDDTPRAMAQSMGLALGGFPPILEGIEPDIVLLQGDRGEMLAAAIAAAHMNIATVHMSGGDRSGSIDDSIRNGITKFANFHLTTCRTSTEALIAMGEEPARIVEVGEPSLDRLKTMEFLPFAELAKEFDLPADKRFLVATLHPITDEWQSAASQMTTLLHALEQIGMTTVFTYPNSDSGGRSMRDVLEGWRGRDFLRIEANLGTLRYFSLLRHAKAMIGNSSSGLIESPSFGLPVVNLGSRQHSRQRADNVIDVEFDKDRIVDAVKYALSDPRFAERVANCRNPYGDGTASRRTIDVLRRLNLGPELIAKWKRSAGPFLAA